VSEGVDTELVERVYHALGSEPATAPRVAMRAQVTTEQAYQALVRLYDEGLAFLWQEPVTRRMRWQR